MRGQCNTPAVFDAAAAEMMRCIVGGKRRQKPRDNKKIKCTTLLLFRMANRIALPRGWPPAANWARSMARHQQQPENQYESDLARAWCKQMKPCAASRWLPSKVMRVQFSRNSVEASLGASEGNATLQNNAPSDSLLPGARRFVQRAKKCQNSQHKRLLESILKVELACGQEQRWA